MKTGVVPAIARALVTLILAAGVGTSFDAQASSRAAPAGSAARRTARAHFSQGEIHYRNQEYQAALVEFEAGYVAMPLPGFLVNIGQCHRHLSDYSAARASFQQFLEQAPDSPLAAEVKKMVRDLTVTPPPFNVTTDEPATNFNASSSPPSTVPALKPASDFASPPPSGAGLAGVTELIASHPPSASRPTRGGYRWSLWLWGAFAFATLAASALVIAGSNGGPATIHDGTLGTLRR